MFKVMFLVSGRFHCEDVPTDSSGKAISLIRKRYPEASNFLTWENVG